MLEPQLNEFPFMQIIDALGGNVHFCKCPKCDHKVIIADGKVPYPERVDPKEYGLK